MDPLDKPYQTQPRINIVINPGEEVAVHWVDLHGNEHTALPGRGDTHETKQHYRAAGGPDVTAVNQPDADPFRLAVIALVTNITAGQMTELVLASKEWGLRFAPRDVKLIPCQFMDGPEGEDIVTHDVRDEDLIAVYVDVGDACERMVINGSLLKKCVAAIFTPTYHLQQENKS